MGVMGQKQIIDICLSNFVINMSWTDSILSRGFCYIYFLMCYINSRSAREASTTCPFLVSLILITYVYGDHDLSYCFT